MRAVATRRCCKLKKKKYTHGHYLQDATGGRETGLCCPPNRVQNTQASWQRRRLRRLAIQEVLFSHKFLFLLRAIFPEALFPLSLSFARTHVRVWLDMLSLFLSRICSFYWRTKNNTALMSGLFGNGSIFCLVACARNIVCRRRLYAESCGRGVGGGIWCCRCGDTNSLNSIFGLLSFFSATSFCLKKGESRSTFSRIIIQQHLLQDYCNFYEIRNPISFSPLFMSSLEVHY